MKKKALRKDFYMEIKKTYNRFLSIFFIVALGVAFFSGIRASEPDMELSADKFYDENNYMDIRVLSTLGLTDSDVEALSRVEGVKDVVSSYTKDVLSYREEGMYTLKVFSISEVLNQITPIEGRLPEKAGECILDSGLKEFGYQVGDVVTIQSGTDDAIEDSFHRTEYKVVGMGITPAYLSLERENSQIGRGYVDGFMAICKEDFAMDAYTEIYLSVNGAKELVSYHDDYDDLVDVVVEKIEAIQKEREEARYIEVKKEADEKIADAEKELADGKKEAEEELADAYKKITDAKKEIADAKKEIKDGKQEIKDAKKELSDGKQEIKDAKKEIADGKKEIAENKEKLNDAQYELDNGKEELSKGRKEYESGKAELESNRKKIEESEKEIIAGRKEVESNKSVLKTNRQELENNKAVLKASKQELEAKKAELTTAKQELEAQKQALAQQEAEFEQAKEAGLLDAVTMETTKQQIEQAKAQITAYETELSNGEAQIVAGEKELSEGEVGIVAGEKQLSEAEKQLAEAEKQVVEGETQIASYKAELSKGEAELAKALKIIEQSEKEIADGQKEIDDGWNEILKAEQEIRDAEQELKKAEKEIKDGEKELKDAEQELKDGEQELLDGEAELIENEAKYWKEKAKADKEIAEAEEELADAKLELADLEMPEWYVFGREYSQVYAEFGQNAERIGALADVFPLFFFLIAALVCLTTMTRMVEEERTQIGTLKALGYSKGAIASKYLMYAGLASLGGGIFGALVGQKILPAVVVNAYRMMYINLPYCLIPYNAWYTVSSIAVLMVCTVSATYFACAKNLKSNAATLMRPEAPKAGKRVLLERIPFIWKRLSFGQKSSVRNLFRYKKRFFMTMIGIGGCMALLVVGFGLRDSIYDIARFQYEELFIYNGAIVRNEDANEEELKELYQFLDKEENIESYTSIYQTSVDLSVGKTEKSAYLICPENTETFNQYIWFRDRVTKEPFTFDENMEGIVLTEKMASMLEVGIGDEITIKNSDDEVAKTKILYLTENYAMHYVYMTPKLYEKLYGTAPEYNLLYYKSLDNSEEARNAFGEAILVYEAASEVQFNTETRKSIEDMLGALDIVIWVLIISAGLLAFVVLYNLNNININERRRELATLRVLGFHNTEVATYVYRESVMLTVFGIILGIFMGMVLHRYVILTVEVDMLMFGRNVNFLSFLYSSLLTCMFSALINWVMYFKLKKIDMVESLKSIE